MSAISEKRPIMVGNAEDIAIQGERRGWFIGHFMQPSDLPTHSTCVEIKWGVHEAGEGKNGVGVNCEGTTLTILIQGEFEIAFPIQGESVKLTRRGDYAIFASGIPHTWQAVTDSIVLTVRWPSIPEDQIRTDVVEMDHDIQYQTLLSQMEELFDRVVEENRCRDHEIMQGVDGEKEHAYAVLEWVRRLSETPSIELEIAALFHDVDRLITQGVGGGFKGDRNSQEYIHHKKSHARRSAEFVCTELRKLDIDDKIITRIAFLVQHHDDPNHEVEQLNDGELNTLVSADSFAFFTTIAPKLYEAEGEERLYDKIKFMVEKMPPYTKQLLRGYHVENNVFQRVKDRVFLEVEG